MGTLAHKQFKLLTDYDPTSVYNTAYQAVYANIRFNWDSERNKQYAIAFTTPVASDGHGVVAANVAIAAAQSGTPVILVDADLQAPRLQQRFGSEEDRNLSDLFSKETITKQTLPPYLHKVFVPGLYLLYGGQGLPYAQDRSRLLMTKLQDVMISLREFLADMESGPGIIIFHSPPVLSGIEAALIGECVDETLLTIVAGSTTRTQAVQAREQLQRAKVPVAGTITVDI